MNWFTLSIISALFSAFTAIARKKAMKRIGLESTISAITFLVGGLALFISYFSIARNFFPIDFSSSLFWEMVFLHTILEVIAIWFLLRAMNYAEITYIGPLLSVVHILVLIPAFIILHEQPSLYGILGIVIMFFGILMINYDPKQSREIRSKNIKGLYFLFVTIACWSFTPVIRKVTLNELDNFENGPLFFAYILSLFIGLACLVLIFLLGESKKITMKIRESGGSNFLILIILTGLLYAIGTWSHYTALNEIFTSYAMVVKGSSPIFIFIIGYLYFKERHRALWKLLATLIVIVGSFILVLS